MSVQDLSILDRYIKTAPSIENAVNIFAGEWSSIFPPPYGEITQGRAELFQDPRIQWLIDEIKGVKGRTVLELGPLEGGHSYMLEQAGARQITAIEANTRAYLKCLVMKEVLNLKQVKFLCGDFIEYLHQDAAVVDICIASGVLYHMLNPVELIALLANHCKKHIFIWTHYYNEEVIKQHPVFSSMFTDVVQQDYQGFKHTLYRRQYETALEWQGFCGGNAPHSFWMQRNEILAALSYFGFENIRVNFEDINHANGPSFAIIADRVQPPKSRQIRAWLAEKYPWLRTAYRQVKSRLA